VSVEDAVGFLDAAAAESPDLPWNLGWQNAFARTSELVLNRRDQRGLNVCAPPVFFRIWLARNQMAAAVFDYRMSKDGQADLGSTTIVPGEDLFAQRCSALRTKGNQETATVCSKAPAGSARAKFAFVEVLGGLDPSSYYGVDRHLAFMELTTTNTVAPLPRYRALADRRAALEAIVTISTIHLRNSQTPPERAAYALISPKTSGDIPVPSVREGEPNERFQ
jgi:hypothetical protein